ncbi:MAG: patatin-like phospholipase family protein [Bacillota bacterium]
MGRKGGNRLGRRKVGLALGGGAARGLAHLGVLSVLEERGIPVDYVAGTSAGSVVGALYTAGLSLRDIRLASEKVRWHHLLRLTVPREGIVAARGLEEYLDRLIGGRTFDQLAIPFAAVCVDVISGEVVAVREGNVARAVRASCAIPGIFSPVKRDGRLLVDGGLLNNLPSDVVREMGADVVIAVDVNGDPPSARVPAGIVQILMRSIEIMQRAGHESQKVVADLLIRPRLDSWSLFDLDHQEDYVRCGRAAAEEALIPSLEQDIMPAIFG